MNLFRTTKLALRNMLANKMRAGLSSLGIIIWVFSVVVLLAVGEGATSSIVSRVSSLGTNLLTITPWSQNSWDVRAVGGSNRKIFTMDHIALIETVAHVSKVAPLISTSKQLIYKEKNTSASINGITPEYEIVNNTSVTAGIFITASAVKNRDKVAVLGPTVVTNLFESEDPIGKTIRIGTSLYTVVWVTKSKGTSGRNSSDSAVFIPITTAEVSLAGTRYLSSISVMVDAEEYMNTTRDSITEKLLEAFKITDPEKATFTVTSQEDALETLSSITSTMKLFLGGIAAISLIVWGIGVMNILLVTVSERTKEIGIRKAIGAKSRDIIEQFLVESVLLTITGWIIGIILSYTVVKIITSITTAITPVVTSSQIILALSFSVATGLFFGIFPAYKAAKMKPIDALRSE
jgi:putative ABC transport system permease protein